VSGRGSSVVQGRLKNVELFELVSSAARASGKAIAVEGLTRASYVGARWKQGEAVRASVLRAPAADPLTQIQRLQQLRDNGAITDEEFSRKKKELLERL
jgi:hypothetical protein